jgi:hypothetical protein
LSENSKFDGIAMQTLDTHTVSAPCSDKNKVLSFKWRQQICSVSLRRVTRFIENRRGQQRPTLARDYPAGIKPIASAIALFLSLFLILAMINNFIGRDW